MKPLYKGLLLGVLQVGLVSALGGKLLWDRAHRPRVWVRVAQYDPNLPIRGRYLALAMQTPAEGFTVRPSVDPYFKGLRDTYLPFRGNLVLRDQQLVVVGDAAGEYPVTVMRQGDHLIARVGSSAFFIPEHAPDPSRHARDEELWMEVTIPRKGPPRPIRLGIKKNGIITPLAID